MGRFKELSKTANILFQGRQAIVTYNGYEILRLTFLNGEEFDVLDLMAGQCDDIHEQIFGEDD